MSQEITTEWLAEEFAWRVLLLKLAEPDDRHRFIDKEYTKLRRWMSSSSEEVGSFIWFCDFFDHDPDAVRRAIKEKRK